MHLRAQIEFSDWRTWVTAVAAALVGTSIGTAVYVQALQPRISGGRFPAAQGMVETALSHKPGLRVLFVGNSLTYVNDLPRLVSELAAQTPGMPEPVFTVSWAPPGSRLRDAEANPEFRGLLDATHWDVVVLQEQSGLGSVPGGRPDAMDQDVAWFSDWTRRRGTIPLLFETWGNRTGTDPTPYDVEQDQITANYRFVGRRRAIAVAPVGEAWRRALRERPSLALWGPDGHHPALAGSYLAASVITTCLNVALAHGEPPAVPADGVIRDGLDPQLGRWLARIGSATASASGCARAVATRR